MDEPMPAIWRDKPANRRRWARLQSSNRFLADKQRAGGGYLSCHYCGMGPLQMYAWDDVAGCNAPDKATTDHVIPLARGGPDTPGNMVVSCFPCNQRKGIN